MFHFISPYILKISYHQLVGGGGTYRHYEWSADKVSPRIWYKEVLQRNQWENFLYRFCMSYFCIH